MQRQTREKKEEICMEKTCTQQQLEINSLERQQGASKEHRAGKRASERETQREREKRSLAVAAAFTINTRANSKMANVAKRAI